ncbi:MAG TPA: 4Fe-4S binding protein [Anaerolineae bacterium]|nr:4Fe-4S binding protein [Anaerolineae bacterium]
MHTARLGGIENPYSTITTGTFIKKLKPSNLALFGSILAVGVIASRGFCGWICPFGSVLELLGALGRAVFTVKVTVPPVLDRALRSLKYVILAIMVFTFLGLTQLLMYLLKL